MGDSGVGVQAAGRVNREPGKIRIVDSPDPFGVFSGDGSVQSDAENSVQSQREFFPPEGGRVGQVGQNFAVLFPFGKRQFGVVREAVLVAAENDDAGDAPFPQFGGGDQGVAAVVAGSGDGEDFWGGPGGNFLVRPGGRFLVWFLAGIFVEAGEVESGAFGDANSGASHHFA